MSAITESQDPKNSEIVIHFKNSYDERMNCGASREYIVGVLLLLSDEIGSKDFLHYAVPMKKLKQYTSTKKDVAKGGRPKPDDKYIVPRPPKAEIL